MEKKICPLLCIGAVIEKASDAYCLEEQCAFWTGAVHIQDHPEARGRIEYNCAFVILAMKNEKGTVFV